MTFLSFRAIYCARITQKSTKGMSLQVIVNDFYFFVLWFIVLGFWFWGKKDRMTQNIHTWHTFFKEKSVPRVQILCLALFTSPKKPESKYNKQKKINQIYNKKEPRLILFFRATYCARIVQVVARKIKAILFFCFIFDYLDVRAKRFLAGEVGTNAKCSSVALVGPERADEHAPIRPEPPLSDGTSRKSLTLWTRSRPDSRPPGTGTSVRLPALRARTRAQDTQKVHKCHTFSVEKVYHACKFCVLRSLQAPLYQL